MKFSYNWLKSYFKSPLPKPKKLAELLTMHSFEVDEVSKKNNDWVLDIDVLSNRACDCFSHTGIAREISAILKRKIREPEILLKENKETKIENFLKVSIQDKKDCLRYTARMVKDVKVGPSPKWLKQRLEACGLQSINNIVDITNYVMLETGQPLHAFDFEKIGRTNSKKNQNQDLPKKIIVRKAKKGEEINTLDGKRYKLEESFLVIADKEDPLALAGIKGGKKAEIDKNTKIIVLESANFDKLMVRKTSKALKLKTDASWRFENGIDPNNTKPAIDRAVSLIQRIAGGKVVSGFVDFYPKKIVPKKINLSYEYINRLFGLKIEKKKIKEVLTSLGFKIKEKKQEIEVTVPTRRLDISLPEDLIEEIGRIFGYEKIPPVMPTAVLTSPEKNLEIFWENIAKDILKEAGFTEVYNYSFIGKDDLSIFDYKKEELIKVENPISLDFQYLRASLIPNLLKNIKRNENNYQEINIFELGKIFVKEKRKRKEIRMLTLLSNSFDFFSLKGIVDTLLTKMGLSEVWYDDFKATPEESKKGFWEKERSAEIKVGLEEIGYLGEISSKILEKMKIKNKVFAFDINFEKLQKLASEEIEFRPISPYPAAVRDIALLVPRQVKAEEVLNKINLAGGKFVIDVDLFDIYEGEELPEGKKNLAFHIVYQAKDRTLTSKEIDKIQKKIIKLLEKDPEWEVRR